ncbi:hypothetical protein GPECTOR_149g28 [Gonium pectorale]|uniref:Uncharacterized protein n=1 Tax=Gonium pectorale TaxID=33097 RepID=A0A150FXV2_GONPE|nr:hypothetical protein GPECTOR_149g28 [Gonium pectorale]|eukprot:KXZ42418.1 hypothetical protein GPECTOR_149g28 [Gonium pectorale]
MEQAHSRTAVLPHAHSCGLRADVHETAVLGKPEPPIVAGLFKQAFANFILKDEDDTPYGVDHRLFDSKVATATFFPYSRITGCGTCLNAVSLDSAGKPHIKCWNARCPAKGPPYEPLIIGPLAGPDLASQGHDVILAGIPVELALQRWDDVHLPGFEANPQYETLRHALTATFTLARSRGPPYEPLIIGPLAGPDLASQGHDVILAGIPVELALQRWDDVHLPGFEANPQYETLRHALTATFTLARSRVVDIAP